MSDGALAIARPEHRALLRSALAGVLLAVLVLLLVGRLGISSLQLSPAYLLKSTLVFAAGVLIVLRALPAHHPFTTLGAANVVTLGRAALVSLLAGLIGEPAIAASAFAATVALTVMLLDGLDGWLARHTGQASSFGARFDMETDAVLVAVLAVLAWQSGKVGAWVLLSGAMRYLFALAAALVPLLRHPVPSSYRGKSIAVIQMLALIIAIAPFCPRTLASALAATALALLTLSFSLDVAWLRRQVSAR